MIARWLLTQRATYTTPTIVIMTKRLSLSLIVLTLKLALAYYIGVLSLQAQNTLSTSSTTDLIPQEHSGYAQGVSGHFGFFAASDWLIIGGGCNFPDTPVAQGGKKRYYAEIYAQHRPEISKSSTIEEWRLLATLPTPLAYPHTTEAFGKLYLYGGETPQGDSDQILTLSYNPKRASLDITTSTKRLPTSRAAGATIHYTDNTRGTTTQGKTKDYLAEDYLIGGRKAGKLTTSMLRIRHLRSGDIEIDEMPPYPGAPLLKVIAWQSHGYIYLLGSIAGSDRMTPSATLSLSGYRYNIEAQQWTPLPLPASGFDGTTFGGGSVIEIEGVPLLIGGVHTDVFLPAIQRSQAIRQATSLGDETILTRLQADNRAYLEMPVEEFRFNATPWSFSATTGHWISGRASSSLAVADAVLLKRWDKTRQTYILYLIAGEVKAGIRTPRIVTIPLTELGLSNFPQ